MPFKKRDEYLKQKQFFLHYPEHLFFYGADHSNDPTHPQFAEISKKWDEFRPTYAIHENQEVKIAKDIKTTVQKYREAGLLRFFAKRDNVNYRSGEATSSKKVGWLKWHFDARKVEMFYILRTAQHQRDRNKKNKNQIKKYFNDEFYPLLKERKLSFEIDSFSEIQKEYSKYWKSPKEWWQAKESWFSPLQKSIETGGVFTNEINSEESWFRNRILFHYIAKKMLEGEKVFVVFGAHHVPVLEPALECLRAYL